MKMARHLRWWPAFLVWLLAGGLATLGSQLQTAAGMRLRRALVTGHFDRNKCMLIYRTGHEILRLRPPPEFLQASQVEIVPFLHTPGLAPS